MTQMIADWRRCRAPAVVQLSKGSSGPVICVHLRSSASSAEKYRGFAAFTRLPCGADGLGLTGQNQTIAILIDTFPNDSDLQAFWRASGLGVTLAQVTKINVPGGSLPSPQG